MTKRYRERLEDVACARERPAEFSWRGRRYHVLRVLGHWREDPGWWRRPDGASVQVPQADLWRVEARNGAPSSQGVYELVCQGGDWRLERIWD